MSYHQFIQKTIIMNNIEFSQLFLCSCELVTSFAGDPFLEISAYFWGTVLSCSIPSSLSLTFSLSLFLMLILSLSQFLATQYAAVNNRVKQRERDREREGGRERERGCRRYTIVLKVEATGAIVIFLTLVKLC